MNILRKEPHSDWELIEVENTLEALQAEVGGYIETLTFAEDACLIVNEDGVFNALPFNMCFLGVQLFGNILLVGINGDEFCDAPLCALRLIEERGGLR